MWSSNLNRVVPCLLLALFASAVAAQDRPLNDLGGDATISRGPSEGLLSVLGSLTAQDHPAPVSMAAFVARDSATPETREDGAAEVPVALDGHLVPSRRLGYYTCWGQSHALCGGYYCSCGKGCGTTCYYYCTLCYCSPGSYTPNGYPGYVKSGTTCPNCPGGWYQPYYGSTGCPYACPAVRTHVMFLLCFCRNHSTLTNT